MGSQLQIRLNLFMKCIKILSDDSIHYHTLSSVDKNETIDSEILKMKK